MDKNNFKALLRHLGCAEVGNVFKKTFEGNGVPLAVDFGKEEIQYPAGLQVNERQTCNFSQAENVVVFECVHKLLEKGYKPEHIELEPKWKVGHGASGGRADILVHNQQGNPLLIIECKTYGKEFVKAWKETEDDGGQLFSYAQQISEAEFLCLYASQFDHKNNTLSVAQHIISHKDNEAILKKDGKLKSFKNASNVKQRYEVWKHTYQQEFTETGIFESNMQAYQIGKSKYTLDDDTSPATSEDKKNQYHRFRTILRRHNIARKETAFEILVNLFLCKIVDEEENKNDLKFCWKGIAYDNYYDFVDRLQSLYRIGMRKFLNDEIMYISNEQIDQAFWTVKGKEGATKKQIQQYFTELKYFSNNAFSLINVHNERLFNKNSKVLVELVQMWQNLRLKTEEQNQFLGDMFENFLDNSIKQSEGQFFTPMPITKFIAMSLPLESKIRHAAEPLRVIDYACGAGHFLTEYAHQIKPLVVQHKQMDIAKYYENIVGIEKEDRLAKVAKVAAYMYGQEQIKIHEEDGLSKIESIRPGNFDVLIANPPFAVEGFLLNLDDKQREQYELINTVEKNSNTNNIQCFFIERAKQLMAPDGVVGVIVPASILSNSDATHVGAREIILKYFDLVSLVELGSGTFGKTGTNTVVLFLRRRKQKPEPAEHYHNRVEDYFGGVGEEEQSEYQDKGLIARYCEHTKLPVDEYEKLFKVTPSTFHTLHELFKTDIFRDYKIDFNKSAEIKNLKEKRGYKQKTLKERKDEIHKRLIERVVKIEKDKLFYFMLASHNPHKALIIKSPDDNKAQKAFLGYEWSGAKGSEGIKYLRGGNTISDIVTPLFDPQNPDNPEKINYLIRQSFLGVEHSARLPKNATYANVADLLDFSRKDFDKALSLMPEKSIAFDSEWDMVKLGDVLVENPKSGIQVQEAKEIQNGKYPFFTSGEQILSHTNFIIDGKNIYLSTGGRAIIKYYDGKASYSTDTYCITSKGDTMPYYLYQTLKTKIEEINDQMFQGIALKHLQKNSLKNLKIPLPPKAIQMKIVSECEAVDRKVRQANEIITQTKRKIMEKTEEIFNEGFKIEWIENLCDVKGGKRIPKGEIFAIHKTEYPYIRVTDFSEKSVSLDNMEYITLEVFKKINNYTISSEDVYISIAGTIGLCGIVPDELNNKSLTENAAKLVIKNSKILNKYFLVNMLCSKLIQHEITSKTRGIGVPKLALHQIQKIKIPVPPLNKQLSLVSAIEKLETQIDQAQQVIDKAGEQRQQIMDKYLRQKA